MWAWCVVRKIDLPQAPGMAYRGQTINNPVTGETMTFVQCRWPEDELGWLLGMAISHHFAAWFPRGGSL